MKFNQKIALITGGNRGLGKNTALRLAGYGADMMITYYSHKEEADSVVSEIEAKDRGAVALQLDVGDIPSFDGFMQQVANTLKEKWGRNKFDFLINNAGIGALAPIEQMTEEVFDRLFNIHFKGVYFLTQKAIPLLNDHGRIINISSVVGQTGNPEQALASYEKAIAGYGELVHEYPDDSKYRLALAEEHQARSPFVHLALRLDDVPGVTGVVLQVVER